MHLLIQCTEKEAEEEYNEYNRSKVEGFQKPALPQYVFLRHISKMQKLLV